MKSLDELKQLYKEAVTNGKDSFIFQGKELLVSYAHYLIQYLEMQETLYSHFQIK